MGSFLTGAVVGVIAGIMVTDTFKKDKVRFLLQKINDLSMELQEASEHYSQASKRADDELMQERYLGRILAFKQAAYSLNKLLNNWRS